MFRPEIIAAKILLIVFILIGFLFLSGCAVSIPIGRNGEYGWVDGTVTYRPNFGAFNRTPQRYEEKKQDFKTIVLPVK